MLNQLYLVWPERLSIDQNKMKGGRWRLLNGAIFILALCSTHLPLELCFYLQKCGHGRTRNGSGSQDFCTGKTKSDIVECLWGSGVKCNRVKRTIKRFRETDSTKLWVGSGRMRSQRAGQSRSNQGQCARCRSRCYTKPPEGLRNNLTHVSEPVVLPLNSQKLKGQHLTFQPGSAPAQKAKNVKAWLKNHTLDFISTQD
jgi:hypothetical protein